MGKEIIEEELFMVHDYITLSVVHDLMDYELSKIDIISFKFPEIIKGLYTQRQNEVFEAIVTLRVILSGRDIKIYEKNDVPKGVEYKFDCRGKEHTIFCCSDELKIQSKMRLCELLGVDPFKCGIPYE